MNSSAPRIATTSFCFRVALAALTAMLWCGAAFAQYTETTLHTFTPSIDGGYPYTPVLDGKGNLFGTTSNGGAYNYGTLYEQSPAQGGHGWAEKVLFSFPADNSSFGATSNPGGSIARDAAGNFYGLSPNEGNECQQGGPVGCGTIWKLSYTSSGWQRTILYSFTGGADQAFPASLTIDPNGNLYGVTNGFGEGTVFELSPNGSNWTFQTIYSFTGGADGGWPNTVILDNSGNLYGTTLMGGLYDGGLCSSDEGSGCGVVFELFPGTNSWTYTTLYSFLDQNDGASPSGPLVLFGGNLFGTAGGGANYVGVVFEVSISSKTESVPYTFSGYAYPSGITADSAGNLYGATTRNGLQNDCEEGCGTLFELSPTSSGWNYSTIYSFTDESDGTAPHAPVIDQKGNLYTVTQTVERMPTSPEVLFELSPASGGKWVGSVVHDFPSSTDGYNPLSSLVRDSKGHLYGTTVAGGAYGWGAVYELAPNGTTWEEKVIYSFRHRADGSSPTAGLALDTAGNLYGATSAGGSANCPAGCGTIFKLSAGTGGTWSFSVLHMFQNGRDGSYPSTAVTLDAAGNVYGVSTGGTTPAGLAFKLTPVAKGEWPMSIVYEFSSTTGGGPTSALAPDAHGNFYGVTCCGGTAGYGIIYELTPTSNGPWTETILYNVTSSQWRSMGTLALDQAGNVYGTMNGGGTSASMGSVFSLQNGGQGWNFSTLYNFTGGTDGQSPFGGVVLDSEGNLYGVSSTSVYEITAGSWKETTLFSNFTPPGASISLLLGPNGTIYGTLPLVNLNGIQYTNLIYELNP